MSLQRFDLRSERTAFVAAHAWMGLARGSAAAKEGRDLVVERRRLLAALDGPAGGEAKGAKRHRQEQVEAVAGTNSATVELDCYVIRLPAVRTPVQALAEPPPQVSWAAGQLAISYGDKPLQLLEGYWRSRRALIVCRGELAEREEGWPQAVAVRYRASTKAEALEGEDEAGEPKPSRILAKCLTNSPRRWPPAGSRSSTSDELSTGAQPGEKGRAL